MAVIQAQSPGEQGVLHLPVCQTGESKWFWAFLRISFVTLMNGVSQTLSSSSYEPEPRLSNIQQTNAADWNISVALS
jgi:hypothetical protein